LVSRDCEIDFTIQVYAFLISSSITLRIDKKKTANKGEDVVVIVKKIATLLATIKTSKNIKSYKKDLLDIRKVIDELIKKA